MYVGLFKFKQNNLSATCFIDLLIYICTQLRNLKKTL